MSQLENTSPPSELKAGDQGQEKPRLDHPHKRGEPPMLDGQKFGKWTALAKREKVNKAWARLCRCECGNEKMVNEFNLVSGKTQSCGCVWSENYRKMFTSHGKSKTPTHRSWKSMKNRCTNPKCDKWSHYGGRGIFVCERWNEFKNFLSDMGERPSGTTLERKDVNGNYEPNNCIWATQKQQSNNRRDNAFVKVGNSQKTIAQLSEEIGMNYGTLYSRLKRNQWKVEDAIRKPLRKWITQ